MNKIITSLALSLLVFGSGCVTADKIVLDSTPRQPTTAVDVFKDGKTPDRKYKEIAELSFLGPREVELRAQKRFIRQAQELGGNGILFAVVPAGQKGGGAFGASGGAFGFSTSWVFTARSSFMSSHRPNLALANGGGPSQLQLRCPTST